VPSIDVDEQVVPDLGSGNDHDGAPAARAVGVAGLLLVVVAVALVVGPTIAQLGRPGPDETFYLAYAKQLTAQGPGTFRTLFTDYVGHQNVWLFPNPLRISYLGVAALWVSVDGVEPRSLAHLSLVSLLLTLMVVYRLLAQRLEAARALFATALLGASPLWLGMARRALQDSFVTLAAVLLLAAFLAALEKPQSGRRLLLFAAALVFAILAKESSVLLLPPLALWAVVEARAGRLPREGLVRLGVASAGGLLACGLLWWLEAGSIAALAKMVGIIVHSPATNEYAIRFGGGPWYRYLVDLMALSPVPTLLGLAGGALVLERARRGEAEHLHLFLVVLAAVTLGEYALLTKNVRYVMLLELPLRVLAVEALWLLLPVRALARRVGAVAAAVLLLAVVDVGSFRYLFLERGLYDPVSAPILTLRGFVPER